MRSASKPGTKWLLMVTPGLVLAVAGGVLLCVEALRVGPLGDGDLVASYHFGSESMVGNGGWHYLSRSTYVTASALEGVALLVSAAVLAVALRRRRASWVVCGYIGLVLVIVAAYWPVV